MPKNSFIMCTNSTCSRAGWCKRFTYIQTSHGALNPEDFTFVYHEPDENYSCYVKNVTRRVYERDNPNDTYDEFNREEYENSNRESRMWEDNETDRDAEETPSGICAITEDSILQFQCCGDRRSDPEIANRIRSFEYIQRVFEELSGVTGRTIVLQDASQHGFSPIRIEPRRTDDGVPTESIRTDDSVTDIRSNEQEQ